MGVAKSFNLKKHDKLDYISEDGVKISDEGWHPALAGNSEVQFPLSFA